MYDPNRPLAAVGLTRFTSRFIAVPSGTSHAASLAIYLAFVALHFVEHLLQIVQIYILGVAAKHAGGLLGVIFPAIHHAEVLHFGYNLFQLAGLLLLRRGFTGAAQRWWSLAIVAQSWHFFEHSLLQAQYLTGHFLFGAAQQTSIGQLLFSRPELHAVYNLLVVASTAAAVVLHVRQGATRQKVRRRASRPEVL